MIHLRAPGRICLFGEHQDYLNLPTISMAISKYIYLEAERIEIQKFIIELPDLNETIEIKLNGKELEYFSKRDYIRSGYNLFLRKGFKYQKGYRIKITGDIPINAGVASSSALVIAWLSFLNLLNYERTKLNSYQIAIEGYNAEVEEFAEAGGMMDHFTSVYGSLVYLDSRGLKPEILNKSNKLEGFVLGNSLQIKNTVDDLARVKEISIEAFKILKEIMPDFNRYTSSIEEVNLYLPSLNKKYQKKIIGNILNRDITIKAKNLIFNKDLTRNIEVNELKNNFYQSLGHLLNLHHMQLRNNIEISTMKIDSLISSCIENGAIGAKINGSGFGGTMFALHPGYEKNIKKIIEDNGAEGFIIKTSNGVESY
ncbi:MAG: galactokinase family protein [Candidatus Heimdallarchaeota archaeon]